MAKHFPTGGQDYGPIAFNDPGATPTEMYFYPERFKVFEGKQQLWGQASWPDGALEDGPITDHFQTITNKPDFSSAVLGIEAEAPYPGDLVVTIPMAP